MKFNYNLCGAIIIKWFNLLFDYKIIVSNYLSTYIYILWKKRVEFILNYHGISKLYREFSIRYFVLIGNIIKVEMMIKSK